MTRPSRAFLLAVSLAAAAASLTACAPPGTPGAPRVSAGIHVGYGRSPFWRYWRRPPIVVVPPTIGPEGPDIELPIEPPPDVELPIEPGPDIDFDSGYGGGFGGDFGGDFGDFGDF